MKTIQISILLACFIEPSFAQGTIEFRAKLQPVPTFEWLQEDTFGGQFFLGGNVLNGITIYIPPAFSSQIRIQDASGATLFLPTTDVSLAPDIASEATWTNVRLAGSQVDELLQGEWSVSIPTPDFPNGALRGQIIAVPEPSTYVLFGCGAFAIGLFAVRKNERNYTTENYCENIGKPLKTSH